MIKILASLLLPFLLVLGMAQAQCPEITGIMVNSCGGNTNEGLDEYFTFRNGANSMDIASWIVTFPSGGGLNFCNTGCGTNLWQLPNTNTANAIAAMTPTCPGLLIEPPGGIIPPHAEVIAFVGASPSFAFDFCGSCNTGPVYAVFTNSFSTIGKFSNSAPRTLRIDFGNGCTDTAYYNPSSFVPANTDGNYVSYNYMTGQPTYITQPCNGCITLPIQLTHFQGRNTEKGNLIEAIFDAEGTMPESLTFYKSLDGLNFQAEENLNRITKNGSQFIYLDPNPNNKTIYYKIEYSTPGSNLASSEVIKIATTTNGLTQQLPEMEIYPNPGNGKITLQFSDWNNTLPCPIQIFSPEGKLLRTEWISVNGVSQSVSLDFSDLPSGYYFLRLEKSGKIVYAPLLIQSEK